MCVENAGEHNRAWRGDERTREPRSGDLAQGHPAPCIITSPRGRSPGFRVIVQRSLPSISQWQWTSNYPITVAGAATA